jgi:hypothetical protein
MTDTHTVIAPYRTVILNSRAKISDMLQKGIPNMKSAGQCIEKVFRYVSHSIERIAP